MSLAWLWFPLLGVVAGLLAGLLGIGGGIILVAALFVLLPFFSVPTEFAMHAALATSLTTIIISAASSAYAHQKRGSVLWASVLWLSPGLVFGAAAGSAFALSVSSRYLQVCVALFCLFIAMQMLMPSRAPNMAISKDQAPMGLILSIAGVFIGGLSALVGIGGGSMSVPLLIKMGARPVQAVGTSSACGVLIGLASALAYAQFPTVANMPPYSLGVIYLPAALGIAVFSALSAPIGVTLAHRISAVMLKQIFGLFLAIVSAVLLFKAYNH